ncbi:phophatidylserine decarboxylase associated domain-containing protein [Rahnella laticis]|uniref:phophatidylserine decarboxylase associated domain-containing protein n=1 Tax=Rahnella laticis TaxID=2787622 RepID=UPI0018A307D3|nr:phosphatidylserine decarboxylase family protein [Rahnella laticis]MBF7995549.1 phophatidylserine decarboxylase associated domain-containing protein [Rahnella laticis]
MKTHETYDQFEILPYPSSLRTGWLPSPESEGWKAFHDEIAQRIAKAEPTLAPVVQDLLDFLNSDPIAAYLIQEACRQNLTMLNTPNLDTDGVPIPRITDAEYFASICNVLLTWWPRFVNNDLVGLPFSAFTVGIDPTLAGSALFGLPQFNDKMRAVLNQWHQYLGTLDSATGFSVENQQWLSPDAKKMYQFDLWKKDSEKLPYWSSWNSFFTRQFKDPATVRPVADPNSNQTVICPNDGSLFRWDWNVAEDDTFWFKDMNYSLRDILSSSDPAQQAVIDKHGLVDLFAGGYIFQTYLNPYNFHRWWVPVNAEVLFDPISVPGAFFNKLVLPDFGGATTASLPYLCEVNARGIIVFKTPDYGHVCCIPLGMSEVSTIEFDPAMKQGAQVKKGQEMGMFNYGGSSFAIIYEKLPGKQLIFMDASGQHYPQHPVLPTSSAGTGGNVTNIGAQIGVWYSR